MKNIKYRGLIILLIIGVFMSACSTVKNQNKEKIDVAALVKSQKFKFKASQVIPQRYPSRILNYSYNLTVKPDSLESYLPYFGQSHTAIIGQRDSGLDYITTKFDYSYQQNKKAYDITIIPKDQKFVAKMFLSIQENGSASLSINSNERDAITYYGDIEALKN